MKVMKLFLRLLLVYSLFLSYTYGSSSNSSYLGYIKDREFFEINKNALNKLYKANDLKTGSIEDIIQKALLTQYRTKKLHLKNLENNTYTSKKETSRHIVTTWFMYPSLGLVSYFEKDTQELEKIKVMTNFRIYDTTTDIKTLLGVKDGLLVGEFHIDSKRFKTLVEKNNDEYFNRIFYSPKESYIITILGEAQYTRVKIFDAKNYTIVFEKDYFDKSFFPDVEIFFTQNEKEFSIRVGIPSDESLSSHKTYSTQNFQEIN